MNSNERVKNAVESTRNYFDFKRNRARGPIWFAGATVAAISLLSFNQTIQEGNYDTTLSGVPISLGETATVIVGGEIVSRIKFRNNNDKLKETPLEENETSILETNPEISNFSEPDSKNLV
jgi:hypothetical protein